MVDSAHIAVLTKIATIILAWTRLIKRVLLHDDHASGAMIPNQNVRSKGWDAENIVEKVRAIHRS